MYLFLNVPIWPTKLPVCLFLCWYIGDSEYLPISFFGGHRPLPLHVVNHVLCPQQSHEKQGLTCATQSFLRLWSQEWPKFGMSPKLRPRLFQLEQMKKIGSGIFVLWVLGGSGVGAACTYLLSHMKEAQLQKEGKKATHRAGLRQERKQETSTMRVWVCLHSVILVFLVMGISSLPGLDQPGLNFWTHFWVNFRINLVWISALTSYL